jgi:hypothetical protein
MSALLFREESGLTGSNFDQSVGWQFNVTQQIEVNGLQWFDDGTDGLSIAHEVGIWDPTGDLLVSVVISAGTAAPLVNDLWRTVEFGAIILDPGEGYIVGGYNGANATDRLAYDVDQETHPAITYVAATFANINGFERPTIVSVAQTGVYGPSFQILPAPGCGALLLIGMLTGIARPRYRTRAERA